MRYVFVINPTAGKGKGVEQLVPIIENCFSKRHEEYKIVITQFAGDARQKARMEAQMGDDVVIFSCGGEGTCFEIVNGIVGYDNASFGIIPCGSANDFLKFFGNKDAFLDIDDQIKGEQMYIDLIKADDEYSFNQCSVGMDAMVADDMTLFKRLPLVSGSMAYNLAVVKTFLRKLGITAKIKIDGVLVDTKRYLFAVCANAPVYGGGYKSAPSANPFDNKLEYVLVKCISRFRVPKFLKYYSAGKHASLDYCTTGSCSVMEIESETPIPVNMDGEIIHKKSVKFEIAKKAIRFIVPASVAAGLKQSATV